MKNKIGVNIHLNLHSGNKRLTLLQARIVIELNFNIWNIHLNLRQKIRI